MTEAAQTAVVPARPARRLATTGSTVSASAAGARFAGGSGADEGRRVSSPWEVANQPRLLVEEEDSSLAGHHRRGAWDTRTSSGWPGGTAGEEGSSAVAAGLFQPPSRQFSVFR
ncbi:hypothetical protein GQ53DRAFT_17357 [Thozetella sp. PMI_491]|nr:hypothetical protein GQ53DRAFT_17357 [Thozetella sp. PMI_491]